MSDLWINIRFGCKHLKIGPNGIKVTTNQHFVENGYDKMFMICQFKPFI